MATGSSMMSGKVNAIIPEVVNQATFEIIYNDPAIPLAVEAGQLELNVMEPVIACNLSASLDLPGRACRTLAEHEVCRYMVERTQSRQ